MLRNYYVLKKIADEINKYVGCKLIEIYTQDKDSVSFIFFDGINTHGLYFSASAHKAIIYTEAELKRARKNTVDLFPNLLGETLQSSTIFENERIIKLEFINKIAYFQLFGGAGSNFFVCDRQNVINEALCDNNKFADKLFEVPEFNMKHFSDFPPNSKIYDALSKSSLLLGPYFSEEVLFRSEISPTTLIETLSPEDLDRILINAETLIEEIELADKAYILKKHNAASPILSLIPLANYPVIKEITNSVSKGVRKVFVSKIVDGIFEKIYKEIVNLLNKEKRRLLGKIQAADNVEEALVRAANYRTYAEILMSSPNPKIKVGSSLSTMDWSGNEIEISLDAKFTLLQNAERYFDKSRRAGEDAKLKQKRAPALKKKLEKIIEFENSLKSIQDLKLLENLRKDLYLELGLKMQNDYVNKTPAERFKVFDLGEGYILYVGKNSANNDELTMKFAKPNDLWFHARGSSGSHAVLRLEGSEKPPKYVIKKAAEITAYYSGARNAKYTPVCYTYKKYVKKFKGANQGAVTISKEEVIMVEPKIPESSEE